MKKIKQWWGNLPPWAKALIGIALAYFAYKAIKNFLDQAKYKNLVKKNAAAYASGSTVASYNLKAAVNTVWEAFYSGSTEDEDLAIETILQVPEGYRKSFNNMYSTTLMANRNSFEGGYTSLFKDYGTSLQSDCQRFLSSSEYKLLSTFFNSL